MSKNILIINLYFEIGGVETLLLRLIRELRSKGFKSTVLLLRHEYDPVLFKELKELADVYFVKNEWSLFPSKWRSRVGHNFDYIFVTINDALILGTLLQQFVYPEAHLLAGVYQTEIFCQPVIPRYSHRKAIQDIFCKVVPNQNKVFGNDAAKAHHEKVLKQSFLEAPVVPLMIDVSKYAPTSRLIVDHTKIVSIGRICDFKTYNFSMLNVVKELRGKGFHITYHIYGDGPDALRLNERIKELFLTDCVFLHGSLDYSNLKQVVSDALVFVGSGTAVMEAAACGVPSIPAIEYSNEAECYGFIHEIEGTSFFEPDLNMPRKPIVDLIEDVLQLAEKDYRDLEVLSIGAIAKFAPDRVTNAYIKAITNSVPSSNSVSIYALQFFRQMIASKLYSMLNRKFRRFNDRS